MGLGLNQYLGFNTVSLLFASWMSVLQNSKEEALNNAFKGDDNTGENNIVQELTKEIISEVQRMTGNDVCCDCGAPGDPGPPSCSRAFQSPSDSQNPVTESPFHVIQSSVLLSLTTSCAIWWWEWEATRLWASGQGG